ncbi:hypothetical protein Caka_2714 [Coraliomargarita akajimensis DSM 45221]|uniref:Carboxypeptidase regulatory-like domain-containing protein n=2 Tax=Coraliomargarita TaxID=442430 RepID=D5EPZ6_CORAD|nr:hypothetical protein Caka_2714 [Coraliomargarita akajimensis DSM 45221]
MNKCKRTICLLFCCICVGACAEQRVTVRVVSGDGEPISGAHMRGGYERDGRSDKIFTGVTNSDGVFTFNANAKYFVSVEAKKAGYHTAVDRANVYRKDVSGEIVYYDPEIAIVLREIVNPIPLVARANFQMTLPEKGQPIGFDFEVCDWVQPYGKGKSSDVLIQGDGYFNDSKDRSVSVSMKFPQEGDGLVVFAGRSDKLGSRLKSDYQAPDAGYQTHREWKRVRIPLPHKEVWEGDVERIDTLDESNNYYFRVRTELDEDGKVISANYGKIYGELVIGGAASKDGIFFKIDSYYFNPTANDRNVEYQVGSNLLEVHRWIEEPKLP